jgi:hypothetical protein
VVEDQELPKKANIGNGRAGVCIGLEAHTIKWRLAVTIA